MCCVLVREHKGESVNERRRNRVDRNFVKTEEEEVATVAGSTREVQLTTVVAAISQCAGAAPLVKLGPVGLGEEIKFALVLKMLLASPSLKLFELLIVSTALAELSWPAILSKRNAFRVIPKASLLRVPFDCCPSSLSDGSASLALACCMRVKLKWLEKLMLLSLIRVDMELLEEVREMITWSQLGIHWYYNSLLALFDNGVEEGFIKPNARHIIVFASTTK
ncbi:hypothetical protein RHSIM_RhsimUnG0158100 [Rhododendron simsii]|uniref:Uncharacterized protein n=1 Tax=Rhododendron simsii TaxID=118357 RepID=A0A834FU39_RHOSS|nr:hypothetical protein RHSIM_RhsimUnG0158100 [Rhododendron simsii]